MIRKYLLAGLFSLLPLVITLWLLKVIFAALVELAREPVAWVSHYLGLPQPSYWELALLSAFATALLLFLVGLLVSNILGRQILAWIDDFMLRVPLIKGIYGATKQLLGAIQQGQGGSFKDVVLVEWPHPGSFTLGFVARRDCRWAIPESEAWLAIYIPTAPNPTSGYVVMVPPERVRPVPISPEQALTWAVSGGVVLPEAPRP